MDTDPYFVDSARANDISRSNAIDTKPAKPTRKKFATPPVKVACLECRASRTRCDGKPECTNCTTKGKSCVYTQSKRGGSRIRKRQPSAECGRKQSPVSDNKAFNSCSLSVLPESSQVSFAETFRLVAPGGGLRQLDLSLESTEYMFDAIFSARYESQDSGYDTSELAGTSSETESQSTPSVRVYASDEDILGGYYTYIHAYFPVLPAPESHQVTDNPEVRFRGSSDAVFGSQSVPDFEPSTPLSLATSALLALLPHPDDPDPSGKVSVQLRREQAQVFAQSAFESIEVESELPDSTTSPGDALSSNPHPINRAQFHPQVALETESIIALLLLSTYEYAQRGNIAKLRNRAGQALNAAIDLGLHCKGDENGHYAESNRRIWWMTYITVCQGSILSNSSPPVLLYDPRFTTLGPSLAADPEAWTVFLEAQQVIVSATQFVIDLDLTLKSKSDTGIISQRMLELDSIIEPLVARADTWTLESHPPVSLDRSELKVAQALRGIARIKLNSARIKLHRYCAFSDLPVFTKKHCDLRPTSNTQQDPNVPMAPACPCSSTFHQLPSNMSSSPSISPPPNPAACAVLPFSSNFSAKVCMKCAFAIAHSFRSLPFPEPIRRTELMGYFPLINTTKAPRMIPIFACCAMQSSYAMIMLCYKTKAMSFIGAPGLDGKDFPTARLLVQLYEGLQMVLDALKNYSMAYEALGGMRDQISSVKESISTMEMVASAFNEHMIS